MATGKPTPREPEQAPAGFSLASLLLLTAVIAVLAAAARQAVTGEGRTAADWLVGGAVAGAWGGLFVGLVLGLLQERKLRATLVCIPSGIAFGAVAGLLAVSPNHLLAAAVGSVVLVLFAIAIRYLSGSPPAAGE